MNRHMSSKTNSKLIENIKEKYTLKLVSQQAYQKKLKRVNTMNYIIKSFYNNKGKNKNNINSPINPSFELKEKSNILSINKNNKNIENKSNKNAENKIINDLNNENQNNILNQIEIKNKNEQKNEEKNNLNKNKNKNKFNTCFLCERSYKKELLFSSECKVHSFCKDCLNSYFKGLKENLTQNFECPVYNCHHHFDLDKYKDIFDDITYNDITKSNKNNELKKNEISIHKFEIYTQKSYIYMNSKNELMDVIKDRHYFCPNCFKSIAFYKTNTHFYKCLNCSYKICKYCHKEYTSTHLISNEKDYCKVYYRVRNNRKKNCFKIYLKQLLFVLSMFILCFFISFFVPFNFYKNKLKIHIILSYIFSIIIMIIIIPFIIILFPYFPYVIAFLDFN